MNRKEAERILIAESISRGNISFMVSENFDPSYFKHNKKMVEGLWNKVYELGGYTPSKRSAEQTYNEFDFTPAEDKIDVKDAILTVRKAHAKDEFNRQMMGLKDILKDPDGWREVIRDLPNHFSNIENILENSQAKDFALDAHERYEYVRERSIEREDGNWKVNFAHDGLNDHFGGYEPGLYLYVARTGKGKTWTCLLDLWYSWFKGANVGIFSLEMDFNKVGLRLDTFESHFSNYDLNRGIMRRDSNISDESILEKESEVFQKYIINLKKEAEEGKRNKFKIWTMDMFRGPVTPRRIEALIKDEGLDFVVIDQLELVSADSKVGDERSRLNEVSRDFKLMSGRLNIPLLVPHQMNRETTKAKEVTDAHVAGSDGPARHAEFVCYLTRDEHTNIMNYKFLKARNAPVDKMFSLEWDWNTGIYTPVDPDFATIQRASQLLEEDEEAVAQAEAEADEAW